MKTELTRALTSWEWLLPECSIGDLKRRRLYLKHTWHLTPNHYRSLTASCPQAGKNLITTVVEVAAGKGHAYVATLTDLAVLAVGIYALGSRVGEGLLPEC